MWCPVCQADVPAELSADQRRLLCAQCLSEVALSATEPVRQTTRVTDAEKSARDLLARWSADSLLDVQMPVPIEPQPVPPDPLPAIKLSEPTVAAAVVDMPSNSAAALPRRKSVRIPWRATRVEPPAQVSWVHVAAQYVSYGGVAGLTYGAALLLWSHFGGPAHYAPTGWLLLTVGQMLLFLGLITLVSLWLERHVEQSDRRLRELIDRLDRAEAVRRRLARKAKAAGSTPRSARAA